MFRSLQRCGAAMLLFVGTLGLGGCVFAIGNRGDDSANDRLEIMDKRLESIEKKLDTIEHKQAVEQIESTRSGE